MVCIDSLSVSNELNGDYKLSVMELLKEFFRIALGRYKKTVYSQEGEDLLFLRDYHENKKGFYVDIGSHHPIRFSNTYGLYKYGWSGICVDANPKYKILYKLTRPRDVFVNCGVSSASSVLDYYIFNDGALNTLSPERKFFLESSTRYKCVSVQKVYVENINDLMDRLLPVGQIMDLLNIDIEGLDFVVLKEFNWLKYAPSCVIVEDYNLNLESPHDSVIYSLMLNNGYKLKSKLSSSCIYIRISIGVI
jgi:hypothetical protein